ncbi:MAG: lycopene beta-cyclase CrtY [Sphingomicrobium sp.]
MAVPDASLIILGGGLAGGLIALALAERRPEVAVTIVEAGASLGGNHVWSFFESDIAPEDRALVEPLIVHRWPAYDVRFPGHSRTIDQPYRSITSAHFDRVVRAAGPAIIHATVASATPTPISVTLTDGRTLTADAVIDTRGAGDQSALSCGWQKFVGQSLRLAAPHGLTRPVVMDACVDQAEGYRFIYLLPFGPSEIFVEDTYYSDTADLDVPALTARIAAYAVAQGWQLAAPNHSETGVLPVLMGGDFDRFWPTSDPLARAGARAALIQPLTSYSLPDAVRFAAWFATQPDLAAAETRAYARAHWQSGGFYRLLSTMLFRAADPPERFRILDRFYRLPAPLIERFYAGRSTLGDKVRILAGRPPVSLARAARAVLGNKK